MKKQNDRILISLVMIILLLIFLVSISINLILGENGIIKKIERVEETSVERINTEEIQIQTKIDN